MCREQSAGIEFGVNGLGEIGFARPIMSERQQPDHGAAGLLPAVTGKQRLKGTLIGAAWEQLLTIDEVEQGHWLAAQGVDDVPVIDDMTVFAVGVRLNATQRHQRRRAEKAVEPIIVKAHAGDGRSGGRAPNRTPS